MLDCQRAAGEGETVTARRLGSGIGCRSVGCKGTSVDFWLQDGAVVAVWTNAECPYPMSDATVDELTSASSDGHNACAFDVDEFVLAYLKKMSRSERKAVIERWSK